MPCLFVVAEEVLCDFLSVGTVSVARKVDITVAADWRHQQLLAAQLLKNDRRWIVTKPAFLPNDRRGPDVNLTSEAMDSCQPAKHFTVFVTSLPLSVLTQIVHNQSRQSLRNFGWSHIPSTDRGRLPACGCSHLLGLVHIGDKINFHFVDREVNCKSIARSQ